MYLFCDSIRTALAELETVQNKMILNGPVSLVQPFAELKTGLIFFFFVCVCFLLLLETMGNQ